MPHIIQKPIVILGKRYDPGDVIDFTGGPDPRKLVKNGFVEPERAIAEEHEKAVSPEGRFRRNHRRIPKR